MIALRRSSGLCIWHQRNWTRDWPGPGKGPPPILPFLRETYFPLTGASFISSSILFLIEQYAASFETLMTADQNADCRRSKRWLPQIKDSRIGGLVGLVGLGKIENGCWKTEISRENWEQKTDFRFLISLQFSDFYQLFSDFIVHWKGRWKWREF